MEEVERETAPAEPDTPKAPAPEQPSAPKPTETAPSPTPKSAMALWEERIAAAALEQDGEAPLPTIRTRRKNHGQMTARSRRLPAS